MKTRRLVDLSLVLVAALSSACTPGFEATELPSVGTASVLQTLPDDAFSTVQSTLPLSEVQGFVNVPNCFAAAGPISNRILIYKKISVPGKSDPLSLRAFATYPANFNPSVAYPAIALFHPGGWNAGNPTNEFSQARYWASRGAIAISFEYRLYSLNGQSQTFIADATADARSAIRWMRKYANALAIDPNRIVASGDSAGGHLALAVALVTSVSDETVADAGFSSVPNAIFAFYPVVDLNDVSNDQSLNLVSPMALVGQGKKLPTTFIWDGTADTMPLTPYGSDANFCKVAGPACHYFELSGAPHGFLGQPANYQQAIATMDSALINLGYLAGGALQTAALLAGASDVCNQENFPIMATWANLYGFSATEQVNNLGLSTTTPSAPAQASAVVPTSPAPAATASASTSAAITSAAASPAASTDQAACVTATTALNVATTQYNADAWISANPPLLSQVCNNGLACIEAYQNQYNVDLSQLAASQNALNSACH